MTAPALDSTDIASPHPSQPAPATPPAATGDSPEAPIDQYERTLAGWLSELMGVSTVGRDDSFFDLGGHSLLAVELFNRIRNTYAVDLPLSLLFTASTVAAIATELKRALEAPAAGATDEQGHPVTMSAQVRSMSGLVPIRAHGTRAPLFILPGMGGSVIAFQELVAALPSEQPVYGLQSIGLDGKTPPYREIRDIAAHFVHTVREVQPHGPYRLSGFSFGGIVAFEMAHQLRADGEDVALLAMLDTVLDMTDLGNTTRWQRAMGHVRFQARRVRYHALRVIAPAASARRGETWSASLRRVRDRLARRARRHIAPAVVPFDTRRIDLPAAFRLVKDANVAAFERYRPKPYSGPIVLFRSSIRGIGGPYDSDANWRWLAQGGLEVRNVPGDHVALLGPPGLRVVIQGLTQALRDAERPADRPGSDPAAG